MGRLPHLARSRSSVRAVTWVAVLSLVAAVAYVLAPVERQDFTFRFRPATAHAAGVPGDPAIARLPLVASTPAALGLTLGCGSHEPSQFRSITTENWDGRELSFPALGLDLQVLVGDQVIVSLGGREILRDRIAVGVNPCRIHIGYSDGSWSLDAGNGLLRVEDSGPRVAEALFVGPIATDPATEVVVVARAVGSSPSPLQLLLLSMWALGVVVVGWQIIAVPRRRRDRIRLRTGLPDALVFGLVVLGTVLLPLNIDDGWVEAIQAGYRRHGEFSAVFGAGGAGSPLGYWFDWLQHWWLMVSPTILVARVLPAVLTLATWRVLRQIRFLVRPEAESAGVWVMAVAFVVGSGAWGMTLRAEPVVALLVTVSLWMAVRFAEGARGPILMVWPIVVALGATVHPAGVLVAAPLLASWRGVWAWIREGVRQRWIALSSGLVLVSTTLVMAFFDSNLGSKLDSARQFREGAHGLSLADELARYTLLSEAPYGSTMRRLSIAFLGLAVVSLLLAALGRRLESSDRVALWTLVVGLFLLSVTPSKWPWHFGGLAGVSALALGLGRIGTPERSRPARWWRARLWHPYSLAIVSAGLVVWALSVSTRWAPFDLRTVEWWGGMPLRSPLTVVAGLLFIGILAAVWWRGRGSPVRWVVLISGGLVIVMTLGTLAIDVVLTDGWTLGRQNLESLIGAAGCGLGDELIVPLPGSLKPLLSVASASDEADAVAVAAGFDDDRVFRPGGFPPHAVSQFRPEGINAVRPIAGVGDAGSWMDGEAVASDAVVGSFRSKWFEVDGDRVVLMVMGSVGGGSGNAIGVQWGVTNGAVVTDAGIELAVKSGFFTDWTLVWLEPPVGVDRVRVMARDASVGSSEAWVASSKPMGVDVGSLGDVVDGWDPDVLMSAPVGPYFPCVSPSGFEGVVVEPPGLIVEAWPVVWQTTYGPAVSTDRYFRWDVVFDPPLESGQVGAHSGDVDNFVFVSQEYLTGVPARVNGVFTEE